MDKQNEKGMVNLLNQEMKELQEGKKQIEEMAKDLKEEKLYALINKTNYMRSAENLYDLGYRKIPENAVVLTMEEYEALTSDLDKTDYGDFENGYSQGYKQGSKETAVKFAEMAKELLDKQEKGWSANMIWIITAKNCIDEICKEITEGKDG